MPVYNAAQHLSEAIESILNQTFSDFEFIIINDGSADMSEEIILSYNDDRIRYFKNDSNRGLIFTLNKGIDIAGRKYIARMDADDISLPHRFEMQISFMENNHEVMVVGGAIQVFGKSKSFKIDFNFNGLDSLYECAVAHPVSFFRRSFIYENRLSYKSNKWPAEDMQFWVDIYFANQLKNTTIHNIQEVLLNYRLHNGQISTSRKVEQFEKSRIVRRESLIRFFTIYSIYFEFSKSDFIVFEDHVSLIRCCQQLQGKKDQTEIKRLLKEVSYRFYLSMPLSYDKFLVLLNIFWIQNFKKQLKMLLLAFCIGFSKKDQYY